MRDMARLDKSEPAAVQWSYPYRLVMEEGPLFGAGWRVPTGDVGVSPRVGHHKLHTSRADSGSSLTRFTSVQLASSRLWWRSNDLTTRSKKDPVSV